MKKLFLFIICAVLSIGARAQFSGSGAGTESDPYRIYTEIHLAQMANFLNQTGVVFELMKDLDLTDYIAENSPSQGWMPIGVKNTPFKGVLKGNGHTISGLSINRASSNYIGLFGCVDSASISNLTLKATSIVGSSYVGSFAGMATNKGSFTDCKAVVSSADGVKGSSYIGGLVGKSTSSYLRCSYEGNVNGEGGTIGGLIGDFTGGTISNCNVIGDVSGVGKWSCVGGLIGRSEGGMIDACNVVGNVSAWINCGGLICESNGTSISNTNIRGNVKELADFASGYIVHYVGGIVGKSTGTAIWSNINYYGDVSGNLGRTAGGVGYLTSASVRFNSVNTKGKIVNNADYTGGIVGLSEGGCIAEMTDCSHFGDITGKNYVGGIVGAIQGKSTSAPTLHTYYLSARTTTNTKNQGPFYDSVVEGTSKTNIINNCTAIGNLYGSSYVGGIIGKDDVTAIYESSSKRASSTNYYVWIDGAYNGSGRCEYVYTTTYELNKVNTHLTNSYYSGSISGTDYVGGIVGRKEEGEIKNCYTYSSNIIGSKNVGGIVGSANGYRAGDYSFSLTLKSNVAINTSITATSSNVGRIYGEKGDGVTIGALGSAESNRALTQTNVMLCGVAQDIADSDPNGTSVGPSMLKLKANYVSWGWDFDNNWNILETECYPYKKYQVAPPVIESTLQSHDTSISGKSVDGGTVYMYYKDHDAVSSPCDGNSWKFTTEELQSGALLQLYTDVEGKTPSYFSTATVKYPGSGTEEDPYRVYTAEDLQGATNSGHYKLMNDIDLTEWINENSPEKGWPAIGRNSTKATYINGDGHKVSGLWINTNESYNGLFSNYSAGCIKNLTVEVAKGKKIKGGSYTGVLIGRMYNGEIVNCNVKGDVEGSEYVGGLAGYVENSTLTKNNFDGSAVTTLSNNYIGGITGYAKHVTLTSNTAVSTVTTTGSNVKAGGLVGYICNNSTISKCFANVVLKASGADNNVGGLVGELDSPVDQSYACGTVSATGSSSYTGGLVGYARVAITNCYSTVNVTGTEYTGGLVGYTVSTIDKCYAKGDVQGVLYGAGLVGELDGSSAAATNSMAINNKLDLTSQAAWGCRVIGGYKNGAKEPTLGSNYALNTMQVSLNSVPQKKTDDNIEGISKTTEELMATATYVSLGWDMTGVWGIDEGSTYPYLLWEVDSNPVADITFDKPSLVISIGNESTITATVLPMAATNKRLSWTTSDSNVATVVDGVVTAVGIGTAEITATSTDGSKVSSVCKVTVVENNEAAIKSLRTLVENAIALYDNSVEGTEAGNYAVGSRAALMKVIDEVQNKISDAMDASDISDCTTKINNAVDTFKSKKISAGADTDIAEFENIIYVEKSEMRAGKQAEISVKLKNAFDATGYQFEVELPKGFSVPEEDDEYLIDLSTERTTAKRHNIFEIAKLNNGNMQVICNSTKNYTFATGDGEVAVMSLLVDDNVEDGEYPIIIRNIAISDVNAKVTRVPYAQFTISVTSCTPGDANDDGYVDVGDITAIVGYIQEDAPENFSEGAADANEDGYIDVGDITAVVNLIIENANSTAGAKMMALTDEAMATSIIENSIYAEPLKLIPGKQQEVSVVMDNDREICGFQFEIKLPEGISVAMEDDEYLIDLSTERTTARKHNIFEVTKLTNGNIQVICSSTKNSVFSGNSGEVVTLTLEAAESLADGVYEMQFVDVRMTDTKAVVDHIGDVTTKMTVGDDTAVEFVEADKVAIKAVYSLGGQVLSKAKGGINIIRKADGTVGKVFVK